MTEGKFKERFVGYDMSGKVTKVIKAKEVLKTIDEAKKDLLEGAIFAVKFTPHLILIEKEKFEKWFGE